MDIIFGRIVIFILILSIMVNTTFTGEHASNSIEQQAGGEEGKEIQAVKENTSTRLGHLYKVLTLSTMIIAGPSVFGQQTIQKVGAAKSQQMTAMKGGNDTTILANNSTTTTTPATKPKRNFDDDDTGNDIIKAAEQKAQTAEQKAQTAEQKAQTAEQKAQTAEQKLAQDKKDAEEAKQAAEKAKKLAELSKIALPK